MLVAAGLTRRDATTVVDVGATAPSDASAAVCADQRPPSALTPPSPAGRQGPLRSGGTLRSAGPCGRFGACAAGGATGPAGPAASAARSSEDAERDDGQTRGRSARRERDSRAFYPVPYTLANPRQTASAIFGLEDGALRIQLGGHVGPADATRQATRRAERRFEIAQRLLACAHDRGPRRGAATRRRPGRRCPRHRRGRTRPLAAS